MSNISPNVVNQIGQVLAPAQAAQVAPTGPTTLDPYSGLDAQAAQAQMGAINAAGPDVFDSAQASMRESRRQLLESIAAAGSAGKAEYQRQAEQSAASRQAMLSSAVAAAQSRNADPATIAALQNTISRPYDEAASARDAASANWANLFAASGVSNAAYMDRYIGSMPLIQQQFKSDLATKFAISRSDAQREIEQTRQSGQLTMAQMALQQAQSDAEIRRQNEAIAHADQIRLQEWARQDKQTADEQAWRQKTFDEDARRFGLQYALDQQQLAISSYSAHKGSPGSGGDPGFFGTGMTQGELTNSLPGAVSSIVGAFKQQFDPRGITGSKFAKITGVDALLRAAAGNTIERYTPSMPTGAVGQLLPKYSTGLGTRKAATPPPADIYSGTRQLIQDLKDGKLDINGDGKPEKVTGAKAVAFIRSSTDYGMTPEADKAMRDALLIRG